MIFGKPIMMHQPAAGVVLLTSLPAARKTASSIFKLNHKRTL
jgi:hypothetical protein